MRGCRFFCMLLLCALVVAPSVFALTGHLTILAVTGDEGNYSGQTADLYLEINPGKGRVFIDTFPLTKVDTQISTRFAQQIACSFLEEECNNYDFIYTIQASSPIIGGPSASAAIAALTVGLLDNNPLPEDVSITGTINSGGIVGPVAGLKEKIEAAAAHGISKVLIATSSSLVEDLFDDGASSEDGVGSGRSGSEDAGSDGGEEDVESDDSSSGDAGSDADNSDEEGDGGSDNDTTDDPSSSSIPHSSKDDEGTTLNLTAYGQTLGVEVVEVATLNDVMLEFTGKKYHEPSGDLVVDETYVDVMHSLADLLCDRSSVYQKRVANMSFDDNDTQIRIDRAMNFTQKAQDSYDIESYYTAASFCFGANVQFNTVLAHEVTKDEAVDRISILSKELEKLTDVTEALTINTLTDLQAYIIVKQRISEAEYLLQRSIESLNTNGSDYQQLLSFGDERFFSAVSWSEFFNQPGKEFVFHTQSLFESCERKIAEANERITYVGTISTTAVTEPKRDLANAKKDRDLGNFELCLFKASKAKAGANVVLSIIGVGDSHIDSVIDNRLRVIEDEIIKTSQKGVFPILAYSYYEYGNSLRTEDKGSALLYLEYALEFSDLGQYFEEKSGKSLGSLFIDIEPIGLFVTGLVLGLVIGSMVPRSKKEGTKK